MLFSYTGCAAWLSRPPTHHTDPIAVPRLKEEGGEGGTPNRHVALLNILYTFAKLDAAIGYVQGMNEIASALYYVFASDPVDGAHAEADTFWVFHALMSRISPLYIDWTGLTASLVELHRLVGRYDAPVHAAMEAKGLHPQLFSFRWLSVLFSQDFLLPDVLRLWDSCFADQDRMDFLLHFSCAMIVCVREVILEEDFAACMGTLQSYPPHIGIDAIISRSMDIRAFEKERNRAIANPASGASAKMKRLGKKLKKAVS